MEAVVNFHYSGLNLGSSSEFDNKIIEVALGDRHGVKAPWPSLSLMAAVFKMASGTFLGRILGLVREQVMAFYFGASGMTDAFLVAYRIPNLLRDLFAEGAFSSAFVPVFTEKMRSGIPGQARALLWTLFVALLGVTGLSL